jgi:hypothetical protein
MTLGSNYGDEVWRYAISLAQGGYKYNFNKRNTTSDLINYIN